MEKNPRLIRQVGLMMTIPMALASGPLVGFFFGSWVDSKWSYAPYGMITLTILGFIAGVKQSIEWIQNVTQESKKNSE